MNQKRSAPKSFGFLQITIYPDNERAYRSPAYYDSRSDPRADVFSQLSGMAVMIEIDMDNRRFSTRQVLDPFVTESLLDQVFNRAYAELLECCRTGMTPREREEAIENERAMQAMRASRPEMEDKP